MSLTAGTKLGRYEILSPQTAKNLKKTIQKLKIRGKNEQLEICFR
jgi:hypothetical protein